MNPRHINDMGGWRSVAAGFIILSFLVLVGLLTFSGHHPHLYVAVGYVLVAAFILTRLLPQEIEQPVGPDTGFRFEMIHPDQPSGCLCCERDARLDKEMK
jgi:hypothetical protein